MIGFVERWNEMRRDRKHEEDDDNFVGVAEERDQMQENKWK